ncbi:MAG: dihydropteroate synthase [Thioalkalispiraceae bacterium]|jgi:dihydropteroate synthase
MKFKNRNLDLSKPRVMGVLNVTPDSFSDGGRFTNINSALQQARSMVDEGAAIIDIGGESTRPGAQAVDAQTELDRVIPIIERIAGELDVIISIDTSKATVMQHAIDAGAHMINDVAGLRGENALTTAAELQVPVCVMHMKGEPRTMQAAPDYQDVVAEVIDFLASRKQACLDAGIGGDQIILDPGFGFGKTVQHNLEIMRGLPIIMELNSPILLGVSRKSTIGAILDRPVEQRLYGSLALASLASWFGVKIIRAHDIRATVDALETVYAVQQS